MRSRRIGICGNVRRPVRTHFFGRGNNTHLTYGACGRIFDEIRSAKLQRVMFQRHNRGVQSLFDQQLRQVPPHHRHQTIRPPLNIVNKKNTGTRQACILIWKPRTVRTIPLIHMDQTVRDEHVHPTVVDLMRPRVHIVTVRSQTALIGIISWFSQISQLSTGGTETTSIMRFVQIVVHKQRQLVHKRQRQLGGVGADTTINRHRLNVGDFERRAQTTVTKQQRSPLGIGTRIHHTTQHFATYRSTRRWSIVASEITRLPNVPHEFRHIQHSFTQSK